MPPKAKASVKSKGKLPRKFSSSSDSSSSDSSSSSSDSDSDSDSEDETSRKSVKKTLNGAQYEKAKQKVNDVLPDKLMKKEKVFDKKYYPAPPQRFNAHQFRPNTRIIVVGQTGSGKTESVVDWITDGAFPYFDNIVVVAMNPDQPVYKRLYGELEELITQDGKIGYAEVTNPLECSVEDFSRDKPSIVIFDDQQQKGAKVANHIVDFYKTGRPRNITTIYMGQSLIGKSGGVPPAIRENIDCIALFAPLTAKRLKDTYNNLPIGDISLSTFKKMFDEATKEKGGYLFIDTQPAEPNLRFRKGLFEGFDHMAYEDVYGT